MKKCPRCNENKDLNEFYKRRNGSQPSPYCKRCTNDQTIERNRTLKRLAIEYKGGKCEICGYCKCDAALDFHHKDPLEKDFGIGNIKSKTLDKIKPELDKCMLLCSNCHREIHWNNSPYS